MTLILKSELLPLLFRAVSVIVAALSGLIGLKVLLKLPATEGVVLIAVLGWMVFMPLGQFGYGRPIYGYLRRDNDKGVVKDKHVSSFINLSSRQAVVASLSFCLLGFAYAIQQSLGFFALTVAFFALGLAGLNSSTYQRDIAYALSREKDYEVLELCRRLVLLLGFLALNAGLPLWAFCIVTLLVGTLTQQRLASKLNTSVNVTVFENETVYMAGLRSDAKRFLFFTTNELLIYNFPLVLFSLLGLSNQIVFVSIWLRMFQLVVLPMRMGVDARMNRLVSDYFRGDRDTVWRGLLINLVSSAMITGVLLILLWEFKAKIFGWLGATALVDDQYLMTSLAVWGVSNTVQHTFGSFTISYGGGFAFASLMSFWTFAITCLAFCVMYALHMSVGQMLIITGVIYGLFALSYGVHVRSLLRRSINDL